MYLYWTYFPSLSLFLIFLFKVFTLDEVQGVCIGLSEVMASAGKSQLLTFMDELIPTIRTALCDRYLAFILISWVF